MDRCVARRLSGEPQRAAMQSDHVKRIAMAQAVTPMLLI